jgi:hypothetical protein
MLASASKSSVESSGSVVAPGGQESVVIAVDMLVLDADTKLLRLFRSVINGGTSSVGGLDLKA